jgi:hypothetical protein
MDRKPILIGCFSIIFWRPRLSRALSFSGLPGRLKESTGNQYVLDKNK